MQADWLPGTNSAANLNVMGQANTADVMPFYFFLDSTQANPKIKVSWLPNSTSSWQAVAYTTGDQVLYNLVYWQATSNTTAADVPGQSAVWEEVAIEPQIPLLFEQLELNKFVVAAVTPNLTGFQGFRQDMLERALRATQDSYREALNQTGTNPPEFRDANDSWTFASTGSWMSFMEVYDPRLRQQYNVSGTSIAQGRQYEVITQAGGAGTYAGQVYSGGEKFYGVAGVASMTTTGTVFLNQVGAFRLSSPADVGKTGLVPDGIEYVQTAGTGTIHGWYPACGSFPTFQAIQPWMIEQGFYVAEDSLQLDDGNATYLTPAPDNPFHPSGRTGGNASQA
jgi:hypothetical protein